MYTNNQIEPLMKKYLAILVFTLLSLASIESDAQIQFGLKAGLNLSQVSIDGVDGNMGFILGPMLDVKIPVIGLSADIALLYDQKPIQVESEDGYTEEKLHYLDVPVNVKYSVGLGDMASVFATTGPQVSYSMGGDNIFDMVKSTDFALKKSEFSWNFGCGVKLLNHLQVAYNYNIIIGRTANVTLQSGVDAVRDHLRNNTHQVTVAYMF